jgi:hypothetical protein
MSSFTIDFSLTISQGSKTKVSYPIVGMVSKVLVTTKRCVKSDEIKGSWTWHSRYQTWTLFALGPESPQLRKLKACPSLEQINSIVEETGVASTNSTAAPPQIPAEAASPRPAAPGGLKPAATAVPMAMEGQIPAASQTSTSQASVHGVEVSVIGGNTGSLALPQLPI